MHLICKEWSDVVAVFTPPVADLEEVRGRGDAARRIVFGSTTLTQRCGVCGKVRAESTWGDNRSAAAALAGAGTRVHTN